MSRPQNLVLPTPPEHHRDIRFQLLLQEPCAINSASDVHVYPVIHRAINSALEEMNNIEKDCLIYEISLGISAVYAADLKPSNILIENKKHVLVSDYGVSCFSSVESQMPN